METGIAKPSKPSLLFIPAIEERFWRKLPELAPIVGGIIVDLEDSIHPRWKRKAREFILKQKELLAKIRQQNKDFAVILRINNVKTKFFEGDIELTKSLISDEQMIEGIMYPKVESSEELTILNEKIDANRLLISVLIENRKGCVNYKEILDTTKGVKWCAVGAEDLCGDLGIDRPVNFYNNPLLCHIAVEIALHAKLQGIHFWGNIWPYLLHNELLPYFIEECLIDKMLCAIGKICFHPYQLEIVNNLFAHPYQKETQKRIMWERLSVIKERALSRGLTVAVCTGRMIDMPELVRARRWLEEETDEEFRKKIEGMMKEIIGPAEE